MTQFKVKGIFAKPITLAVLEFSKDAMIQRYVHKSKSDAIGII
jgi:hypothetical protein